MLTSQQTQEMGFSETAQLIISMLPHMQNWLAWAFHNNALISADNEEQFITLAQEGLEDAQTITLKNIQVPLAPSVLFRMAPKDLQKIQRAVVEGKSIKQALALLKKYDIFSQTDYNALEHKLDEVNLSNADFRVNMSISDRSLLYRSLVSPKTSPQSITLSEPASQFATQHTQQAAGFLCAHEFYQHLNSIQPGSTETQQQEVATGYWHKWMPILWPYLQCPVVNPDSTMDAAAASISLQILNGTSLGFSSIENALAQTARLAPKQSITNEHLQKTIESTLVKANNLVRQVQPTEKALNQDASLALLTYRQSDIGSVQLQINRKGIVSIAPLGLQLSESTQPQNQE